MGSKALVCLWGLLLTLPVLAMADSIRFNIAAQPLPTALKTFAAQANMQLLYRFEVVKSATVNAVVGDFDKREALEMLLNGTGLEAVYSKDDAATIRPAKGASRPAASDSIASTTTAVSGTNGETRLAQADPPSSPSTSAPSTPSRNQNASTVDTDLGEIVVTGTNIRGVYPSSSPVQIYTAEDIARTGATTTEQFIQKLPQNMGTRTQYSSNAFIGSGNGNDDSVAGVDLRGLGVGTTLALMNGRRLGLADFGRIADVSMIPASAIERVEVLTDGASAIYGSDAVGGVVNFVLRKDFDGAETRLSYGGVTSGDLRQGDFSQTFGRSWSSGHGLVAYSAQSASALEVVDRAYAVRLDRGTLTPTERRHNLLLTASQDIGERFTVGADIALARRDAESAFANTTNANPVNWDLTTRKAVTDQIFANLALDYGVSQSLHGSFKATYAQNNTDRDARRERYNLIPPTLQVFARSERDYDALDLTAMLDGTLFSLPGGTARFSLGAGFFDEEYSGLVPPATVSTRTLGRSTSYAFGELHLPLIGAGQHVPLVQRLELSAAARYTRYDDQSRPALHQEFGDATDPKIGLLWAPTESLALRATYGTSFRAPSLVQLDDTAASFSVLSGIPIPFPTGSTASLLIADNRPALDLEPETATTYTLGFDFRPSDHPRLRVSGTYYNISYEDRIGQAPLGGIGYVQTPQLYPLTIYRPPSAAFLADLIATTNPASLFLPANISPSNPAAAAQALLNLSNGNVWIVDQRNRNLALSEQDGVDLSISNGFGTSWGEMRYGANITRILSYRQQAASTEPVVSVINKVARPVDFRGRAYVGVSRGGFDGTLSVNYVDDYMNQIFLSAGQLVPIEMPVESWTTTDLSLSYDFGDAGSGLLNGLRLSLSAQNLFDRDPSFVAGGSLSGGLFSPYGFDPTNANPLGRIVVLGLTKTWGRR